MPRPRLKRHLRFFPKTTYYKPQGIPLRNIETIELSHEEWEALRLKHKEKLNQNEASLTMNTSQSTYQRILSLAHEKIAKAIIDGKALKISYND